jgi:hypothetical protein
MEDIRVEYFKHFFVEGSQQFVDFFVDNIKL